MVMTVPMMATMHEHVHEETGKRQKPESHAQHVISMFGEHEHGTNSQEANQDQPGRDLKRPPDILSVT